MTTIELKHHQYLIGDRSAGGNETINGADQIDTHINQSAKLDWGCGSEVEMVRCTTNVHT